MKYLRFPYPPPKGWLKKFHFAILRIEVTRASRGLSVVAELLVFFYFPPQILRRPWADFRETLPPGRIVT